jgi:crotonobetainyl-CoA:carnitine CoA-transferase CaiB-like acyl-CoA transferase
LDAEELCAKKPGLIHATVVLHGEKGPWSNRPGFDEIGATVSGVFALEGSLTIPKQPPIESVTELSFSPRFSKTRTALQDESLLDPTFDRAMSS